MKYINGFLILISYFFYYANCLEFNATKNDNGIILDALIGNPPQSSSLLIDCLSPYSWVNDSLAILLSKNTYEPAKSKSIIINHQIIKFPILSLDKEIYAKYSTESIDFGYETVSDIPLYLISDSLYQITQSSGALGLGIPTTSNQKESSFLYLLANNSEIPYKVFTIQFYPDNKILFTFGKIPVDLIENNQHFALFNSSLNQSAQFGAIIDLIYINDKSVSYPITQKKAILNFQSQYTYSPISFLIFLERNVFNELVLNEQCSLVLFDNKDYGFICTEIDLLKGKTIIIEIENWSITLPCDKLFFIGKTPHEYNFGIKSKGNENDDWVFGESFTKNFISVFDFELNQFGFYNTDKITYIGKDIENLQVSKIPTKIRSKKEKKIMMILLSLLCICILIGTSFIAYRFFRRRKMFINAGDYNLVS